jgi:hypothetical protein
MRMLPVVALVTVFLGSVERSFSVPAMACRAVARSLINPGRRPPPEAARSGVELGEHGGNLSKPGEGPMGLGLIQGLWSWCIPASRRSR